MEIKKMNWTKILALLLLLMVSFFILTSNRDGVEVRAKVIGVDNSAVVDAGISKIGGQLVRAKILEGEYKGNIIDVSNELIGRLDFDTIYHRGDRLLVALYKDGDKLLGGKALDNYRIDWELGLAGLFFTLLIVFAKVVGLKAVVSFIVATVLICRIYIPLLLKGINPLILTILLVCILSAIILFSIAGFGKKGIVAFLGTISGLAITFIVTYIFGAGLKLYGYTAPFSESLLFSGNLDLDIRGIFYSAIILGASGAAMDIAIDVAASMEEIWRKCPHIGTKDLIESGFSIGRDVIGTMTTTLLLAYSGGYLTLLMLFYSKESSIYRLLNLKIIAAEIMRILVGSIGLVIVAPTTALIGGIVYTEYLKERSKKRLAS